MRLSRVLATVPAAVVLATAVAAPAEAIPDMVDAGDLLTVTIALPTGGPTCTVSYTPLSKIEFLSTGIAVGRATEVGQMKVSSSSGCGSVSWTATATITDQSPGHPTVSRTAAAVGNPATATAQQNVDYRTGAREAGVVTFTLAASSRLGNYCFRDVWEVTALGNPSPVLVGLC